MTPREFDLEPERYELAADPLYRFELDRRDFLRTLGGGLLVVLAVDTAPAQQEPGVGRRGKKPEPKELSAWLHIGAEGAVTVYTGKTEVGQNIRTSLTQVVAEELCTPVASIRLVMADTDLTPYDAGTFGSRTTPAMAPQLRKAAAAARDFLIDRAAAKWQLGGTARTDLAAGDGKVRNRRTGAALTYGELTAGSELVHTIADDVPTRPATEWKIAGTSVRKVGGRALVTGAHRYTSDLRRPGQLHGKVLRAPSLGARLVAFDGSAAEAMPGVTVMRDGDFAAVAAPDPKAAERALEALRAEWKETAEPLSHRNLVEHLRGSRGQPGDGGGRRGSGTKGSIEEGMAAADKRLTQTYTVAYIAHVPLEPRAAVAEWQGERLTVWTGTQRPFGVRSELAQAFRIPEGQVRVIVPDTGSGYGGKHTGEAAVEAARLARAAGRPVKLVWTREEEFAWGYLRPAGLIEIRTGVRSDGRITAWEFHNYLSGASALAPMYDIANQRNEFHAARSPLRTGSYRGLAATANHFARESHMDELARAVGVDPLELRLRNCKDARLQAVLEAAAARFGWGKKKAPGRGFGLAGGFEKGSYVATCAEVEVERASGRVRIVRVVEAFECGAVLNPDQLRNQVEGSIVQGIGGALFEAIEFDTGRILNGRLARYRVPRFSDTPEIDVVLLDRKDLPSAGAGETPIVGIAPAVGNAIFDAAGVRLTSLPMVPAGLKAGAPTGGAPG